MAGTPTEARSPQDLGHQSLLLGSFSSMSPRVKPFHPLSSPGTADGGKFLQGQNFQVGSRNQSDSAARALVARSSPYHQIFLAHNDELEKISIDNRSLATGPNESTTKSSGIISSLPVVASPSLSSTATSSTNYNSCEDGEDSPCHNGPAESRSEGRTWKRGRWTPEEEAYAERLIDAYLRGELRLGPNLSLRKFLAQALGCDPMRISKKFPLCKYQSISPAASSGSLTPSEGHGNDCGAHPSTRPALQSAVATHLGRLQAPEGSVTITHKNHTLSGQSVGIVASSSGSPMTASVKYPSWTTRDGNGWIRRNKPKRRAGASASKGDGRRGRWTLEEEAYAETLIKVFKVGLLPLPGSTSLRTFLSEVLNCSPMRVSKKFSGCVRKFHFYRRQALTASQQSSDPSFGESLERRKQEMYSELHALEQAFLQSISAEDDGGSEQGEEQVIEVREEEANSDGDAGSLCSSTSTSKKRKRKTGRAETASKRCEQTGPPAVSSLPLLSLVAAAVSPSPSVSSLSWQTQTLSRVSGFSSSISCCQMESSSTNLPMYSSLSSRATSSRSGGAFRLPSLRHLLNHGDTPT